MSAWEKAWQSYSQVSKQLTDYGHFAIEKANKEYEDSKANLASKTKDLKDMLQEQGDKMKEGSSDLQVEAIQKLYIARREAYEKYLKTKESLKVLFMNAYKESEENIKTAEDQVKNTTSSLQKHLENVLNTTDEEFKLTKLKLEEAKEKALKNFEEAKAHAVSLSERISSWSEDVLKILSEESLFLSENVKQISQCVIKMSKEKAEGTESLIYEKSQEVFDTLKEEALYALDIFNGAKESLKDFWKTAVVGEKSADIKPLMEEVKENTITPPPPPPPVSEQKEIQPQTQTETKVPLA
jgi:predicted component of type VI protein secretion system